MIIAVLVGLLGGLGAGCRYVVDSLIARRAPVFPLGTCVINIVGSLLLGFIAGGGVPHWSEELRIGVAVGFCGGFTTFSTASLETVRLARSGSVPAAAGHLVVMVFGSVAGAALGLFLGRAGG